MKPNITINRATVDDSTDIAIMVGELLNEIMQSIGEQAFHFDLGQTTERLQEFLREEKYYAFIARNEKDDAVACLTVHESHALYAEGLYGIIPECYVRPAYRSQKVGQYLLSEAASFGATRGWKRLEVTTPPLPFFEKTLSFYEREGFTVSGGRKLKRSL